MITQEMFEEAVSFFRSPAPVPSNAQVFIYEDRKTHRRTAVSVYDVLEYADYAVTRGNVAVRMMQELALLGKTWEEHIPPGVLLDWKNFAMRMWLEYHEELFKGKADSGEEHF